MMDETLEYFKKCEEFDNAIRVNKENKEYLKKYIITAEKVEEDFKYKTKKKIALGLSVGAGVVIFAICLLIMGLDGIIPSAIAAVVAAVACTVFMFVLLSKKLRELVDEQDKVNAGITEQMVACERRVLDLKTKKDEYLAALEDRNLVIIPTKYVQVAEKIVDYVKEGNAQSVQEAIDQLEQQVKSMKKTKKRRS